MTNTEQVHCMALDLEGPIEDARIAVQILVELTTPPRDISREKVLFLAGRVNRELEGIHEQWSRALQAHGRETKRVTNPGRPFAAGLQKRKRARRACERDRAYKSG